MYTTIGRKKTVIQLDRSDYKKFFVKGNFINITSHGYIRILQYLGNYKYKQSYLHRLVLNAPSNLLVDHINGDRLDDRKKNLRLCNIKNNAFNKKGRKGYKGIYLDKRNGKWIAQITKHYKTKSLGTFFTKEEAALAYNKAAKRLHGKYAFINKILK